MDDVIAAASSSTTTITSQINQEDSITVTSGLSTVSMSTPTKEIVPSNSSAAVTSVFQTSETGVLDNSKVLVKASSSNQSVTTTTSSATTITSIVSPIVIPSFKVGMGSMNKETNVADIKNEISHPDLGPPTTVFPTHQPVQGIYLSKIIG